MPLTSLPEAKAYMGVTTTANDAEIALLVEQADGVVQNHAGPALQQATFVERHVGGPVVLLHRYPIVSITSVSTVYSGTVTAADVSSYGIADAELGEIFTPSASRVEVTYVAGFATPPAEAVDAALLFVSYKYRRNHGGSETYMPAGADSGIAPPMGVGALEQQIRLALGSYARGPSVA